MPVLNEEGHIRDSVAAMRGQHFAGTLEFLVVDGGSSDRTREILLELAASDPRIRVLDNPRRITSSGLNVALGHARGRYVARMDAHTEYQANYVALGIRRLREGDTAWVSGPPVPVGRGPVSRAVALALRSPLGRGGSRKWAAEAGEPAREYALDSGVFAGVWERETLLACGGWDEDWMVNQDSEMAGRFLAAGEPLICLTGMAAFYTPRDSLRGLWRQYLRYGEFREKTAVRHAGHIAPLTPARAGLGERHRGGCGRSASGAPRRPRGAGALSRRVERQRVAVPQPGPRSRLTPRSSRRCSPPCTTPTASAPCAGPCATAFPARLWPGRWACTRWPRACAPARRPCRCTRPRCARRSAPRLTPSALAA